MKNLSILVPTDFSDGSLIAVETALDLGSVLMVPPRLTLLHVWAGGEGLMPELNFRTDAQGKTSKRLLEEARAHGLPLEHAAEFLAHLEKCGIAADAWMRSGPVAETIAKIATEGEFDLVVMGTHGRTGVRATLLGSVAEKVVRMSPVPVLTARVRREARATMATSVGR